MIIIMQPSIIAKKFEELGHLYLQTYCFNCSHPTEYNWNYCEMCGTKLKEELN